MGGNGINTLTKDAIGGHEPPYLLPIDSPESVPHHFKYENPLWRQSEMPAGLQLAAVLYGAGGDGKQGTDIPVRTGVGGGWSYSSRLGVMLVEEEMEELEVEEACS